MPLLYRHRKVTSLLVLLTGIALTPIALSLEPSTEPMLFEEAAACPAEPRDNPLPESIELATFTCQGSYTVSCSGSGSSCTAATNAFIANCQSSANAVCTPDPTCNLTRSSTGCTGGGGSFSVSGSATFGCKMIW